MRYTVVNSTSGEIITSGITPGTVFRNTGETVLMGVQPDNGDTHYNFATEQFYEDAASKLEFLRLSRNARLAAVDGLVLRHKEELDRGVTTTLSAQQYMDLLTYKQALRDIPSQYSDIETVVWPDWPL